MFGVGCSLPETCPAVTGLIKAELSVSLLCQTDPSRPGSALPVVTAPKAQLHWAGPSQARLAGCLTDCGARQLGYPETPNSLCVPQSWGSAQQHLQQLHF